MKVWGRCVNCGMKWKKCWNMDWPCCRKCSHEEKP